MGDGVKFKRENIEWNGVRWEMKVWYFRVFSFGSTGVVLCARARAGVAKYIISLCMVFCFCFCTFPWDLGKMDLTAAGASTGKARQRAKTCSYILALVRLVFGGSQTYAATPTYVVLDYNLSFYESRALWLLSNVSFRRKKEAERRRRRRRSLHRQTMPKNFERTQRKCENILFYHSEEFPWASS